MPCQGIAPAPRRIAASDRLSRRRGRRRLQVSFRRAFTCTFWRLGFRQSGFRHITRISRRTAPDAWARSPVFCHAIFPCVLSNSGKASDPEISPLISARCAGDTTVRLMAHAGCKTVGSAYVGSNPTPATTCENGPLAGNSRLCGPFLLCPVMCHLVALWTAVSRCPRTYSGRRPAARTVGVHRRLSTDGHGRAAPVACSGLTCAAEVSVHSRTSGLAALVICRGGAAGEGGCADGRAGDPGERDGGRAGGAGAGRPRVRVPCQVNV